MELPEEISEWRSGTEHWTDARIQKIGTDADGHFIYDIEETEVEIVRRIFREYIAGTTVTQICRGLEADGIPTKLGKTRWRTNVILSILSNEKYTGNAILGKPSSQMC